MNRYNFLKPNPSVEARLRNINMYKGIIEDCESVGLGGKTRNGTIVTEGLMNALTKRLDMLRHRLGGKYEL